MPNIAQLLLAAGSSSRMGTPKPLLDWKGKTLIEFQLEKLYKTNQDIYVVLGSKADKVHPVLNQYDLTIVENEHWNNGMGSSIAAGVQAIQKSSKTYDAVLVVAVDQPLIDIAYLTQMIEMFNHNYKQIIVSESSEGWRGIPTLFDQVYFEELAKLEGDQGAKSVVKAHESNVITINAGLKLTDIDTPEEYQKLLHQ